MSNHNMICDEFSSSFHFSILNVIFVVDINESLGARFDIIIDLGV